MSNASKKRGGIANFWDTVAPPAEEVPAPGAEPPSPPETPSAPPEQPAAGEPKPSRSGQRQAEAVAPRPRGRPPTGVIKERMTVNLSPRSLQILESLRYRARMKGQRGATFSELLDEAVALLAKHYKLKLEE